jgi:hypothetical protein
VIRHLVLFTLRPDVASELPGLLSSLNELRDTVPQIRDLACGPNLASSGYTAAITVDVADEQALADYRAHPAHQPVLEQLRALAERIDVADIALTP